MAELTIFAYHDADSWVHRMDIRIKLLATAGMGYTLLTLSAPLLVVALAGLLIIHSTSGAGMRRLMRAIVRFMPFLLFVFIARWLSTPGRPLWAALPALTIEGLQMGMTAGLRLAALVLMSMLLTRTTLPAQFSAGIAWLGRPIPWLPEKKAALMLGLVLRLLPLILQQLKETAEAQRARGVGNRKNPVFRLTCLALPAMRQLFARADHLAEAMLARGYTDARVWPVPPLNPRDFLRLLYIGLFCLLLCWLDTLLLSFSMGLS
jgi:energy-coupling factor transporter transmembrane protein EcfT